MKTNNQFDAYAAFYDLLYKDKNYKAEAEYIDQLIDKFSKKKKKETDLLDLACGTGRHLQQLYTKGYRSLLGSDISKSMIDVAKKNAKNQKQDFKFYNYSFQESHQISRKFDVIISMFSSFNYLISNKDQSRALNNIYNLLNNDGLFIFDYWNGNAVTQNYSPVKVLRKKEKKSELIRVSETKLDLINQDAIIKFRCNYLENDKKILDFEETHHLHYYYFSEMKNLLTSHHFEIVHMSPFNKMNKPLSPYDWNISIIAKKSV